MAGQVGDGAVEDFVQFLDEQAVDFQPATRCAEANRHLIGMVSFPVGWEERARGDSGV